MNLKSFLKLTLFLFVILTSGCTSKNIVYLKDAHKLNEKEIAQPYDLHIKKDDMLSIIVNSKEPELAAPFNMALTMSAFTGLGNVSVGNNGGSPQSFLVDSNGEIDYPVFGTIKVEGMTRKSLSDSITTLLKENGYIQDPLVNVRLLNFKVSVLGEVARPGQLNVQSERITLMEAIAQSGDLTIYGRRNNIKLIREENGKRIVKEINLQDSDIINSPDYYLQQNDLVYIEPNGTKASQRSVSAWWGTVLSIMSLATTIGLYFAK